jgi:hypothetical protein
MTRYMGKRTGATIFASVVGLTLMACGAANASFDGRDAVSQVRQVSATLQDQHDLVQAKLERWAPEASVSTDRQDLVDAKRGIGRRPGNAGAAHPL